MTIFDDVATTLSDHIDHLREELDKAERMLLVARGELEPNQVDAKPARRVTRKAAKPKSAKKAKTGPPKGAETRKRFTDEEKANAVDRAKELGSDRQAASEFGTTSTSVKNWRTQGFGGGS